MAPWEGAGAPYVLLSAYVTKKSQQISKEISIVPFWMWPLEKAPGALRDTQ